MAAAGAAGGAGGGAAGVPPAAGIGGGPPNPAVAAAAAVPLPPNIILSPWQGDIDLNTKHGKALWDEGIKPIDVPFTGQGKDLVRFLALISNQVAKCHWTPILTIGGQDLLTKYGEITLNDVKAARTA